jgi:hypothetical protein
MPVKPVLDRLRWEDYEVEARLACIAWSVFQTLDCVLPTQILVVFVVPEDAGWLLRYQGPVFSPTASLGE